MRYLLLACLALGATGCAMSRSHFETMDGDKVSKMALSTIGKQEVQQKTDFHVMPNNSGLDLQDGAVSSQDTTQVIALLQTMLQAYVGMLQAKPPTETGGANDPTVLQRILTLTQQVEQLRSLVQGLLPAH